MSNEISVMAAVVLPGWKVERKVKSDVFVWSDESVVKTILSLKDSELSREQTKRIADRVEDHCRNVDFV